jgi:fatty acid amide hydrolase
MGNLPDARRGGRAYAAAMSSKEKPMVANELSQLGAVDIAALIARGEVSAREVTDARIAVIEQRNPQLNALVAQRFDAARQDARLIDARRMKGETLPPLAGVPTTIKDVIDVEGLPSTGGLPSRKGHRAAADCPEVATLKRAGAVVLGKTNVAQALIFIETDNPLHGRCNHPLDAARTPGGSSGGEAALIAAGGSSLGLGTDIGGSVRVPAAFCGIASMKPTAGRITDTGRLSVPAGQLGIQSQLGPLGRRVADVETALRVLNPASFNLPASSSVDVSALRVGVYEHDGVFAASPGVRRAVREAAAVLRAAGATIVDWKIPDPAEARAMFFAMLGADGGAGFKRLLRRDKKDVRVMQLIFTGGRSRPTRALLAALARGLGQRHLAGVIDSLGELSVDALWQLCERQIDYRERFARAMDRCDAGPLDLLIGPPVATSAFVHGATKDLGLPGIYSLLYNVLGYPAGVVPVGKVRAGEESDRPASKDMAERAAARTEAGSAGLPLAVQVAARPWHEHQALAAMAVIEAATKT